ncbi:MAG TPA: DUF3455 domain-containing protein [Chthonomonadaceae bacterium]|nr:DUF3455 domain-containing protein [Chthonomonadaceae bacterium]
MSIRRYNPLCPLSGVRMLFTVAILCFISAEAACAQAGSGDITPPDGQVKLFSAQGKGVQIYISKAKEAGKFEWVLKEPKAKLYDHNGKEFGRHYKGPAWEAKDHSKVLAKKIKQSASPESTAIPWLLLESTDHTGSQHGLLSKVAYIQRIDTTGGVSPTEAPKRAGIQKRVSYTATYVFWGAAPDGTTGGH